MLLAKHSNSKYSWVKRDIQKFGQQNYKTSFQKFQYFDTFNNRPYGGHFYRDTRYVNKAWEMALACVKGHFWRRSKSTIASLLNRLHSGHSNSPRPLPPHYRHSPTDPLCPKCGENRDIVEHWLSGLIISPLGTLRICWRISQLTPSTVKLANKSLSGASLACVPANSSSSSNDGSSTSRRSSYTAIDSNSDKKVSCRKQIARQLCVTKNLPRAGGVVDPVKIFLASSSTTVQNLVAVSHTVRAHVKVLKFGGSWGSAPGMMDVADP